jgi:hypothetical protein
MTGDLDKVESRNMGSGNDPGTRLTGCDGGIDEPPREELFSLDFPLLSPATPKSRGS